MMRRVPQRVKVTLLVLLLLSLGTLAGVFIDQENGEAWVAATVVFHLGLVLAGYVIASRYMTPKDPRIDSSRLDNL